ncbi:hypothetical protein [Parafrankia elaeagni]|uniref:hypothetical protein n=1 Tax=Parafrankia elaeagni TaxID=222534 RepID=UPI000368848D|nr:hypothetical protein [Parafrankia elaeagni]
MINYRDLVERYMAIWNEPDPTARRRAVEELWAPTGEHFVQTYGFQGYDAIEGRVGRAHTQWVRDGGYLFLAGDDLAGHGNLVKFSWEMVPAAGGEAASTGFDVLVLDDEGRILIDHQFNNPAVPSVERNELADRYLAVWNEPDQARRRERLAAVWAPGGTLVDAETGGTASGLAAVEKVVAAADPRIAAGYRSRRTGDADGHRDVLRLHWELRSAEGRRAADGFDFLVLDSDGRISAGHRFVERAEPGI